MADGVIAHLGFIQSVISRMAANSFLIKGWVITLVAAIFALSSKESNPEFVYLAFFPLIFFWWLDAFYLHQEKLYRELYRRAVVGGGLGEPFTMDASVCKDKVGCVVCVLVNKTIWPFYLGIVVVIFLFMWKVMGLFNFCQS